MVVLAEKHSGVVLYFLCACAFKCMHLMRRMRMGLDRTSPRWLSLYVAPGYLPVSGMPEKPYFFLMSMTSRTV